jgi:hypothetical protein
VSVTAPVQAISVHDLVLNASVRTYELSGHVTWTRQATAKWAVGTEPFDLFVPEFRRIEEVETAETLQHVDLKRLAQCRQAGLEVLVLVPLNQVGVAQTKLRGFVDKIQPWWIKNNRVLFGEARLA